MNTLPTLILKPTCNIQLTNPVNYLLYIKIKSRYASQWFLTLYTAKFPLYMVFRILDLFLYEGISVVFTIALALLKHSQRDLLALDFEGVLKHFRVSLPKKYRHEPNFKDLMVHWHFFQSKLTDKKIKKLEQKYKHMKEQEALREDPTIRFEREIKRLNVLVRRLEQENDDLANEYIDHKVNATKQVDELKEDYELVKTELIKYRSDYQAKFTESADTNKRLMSELEQIKSLWRKDTERYEHELERSQVIINEYKQICNKLSNKIEKWGKFKESYEARGKTYKLCDECTLANKLDNDDTTEASNENVINSGAAETKSSLSSSNSDSEVEESSSSFENMDELNRKVDQINDSLLTSNKENRDRIKALENELARVKLELVDSQCKNQEYDHFIKTLNNNSSSNGSSVVYNIPNGDNVTSPNHHTVSTRSNSTSSQMDNNQQSSSSRSSAFGSSSTLSNGSVNATGAASSGWLSKTFTQFKEATNKTLQAQKAKIQNSPILDQLKN